MKERDANLDLYRCILMFLIVLYHASMFGKWSSDALHWSLGLFFNALIFWHVDGFISLSGWFGVRFSLVRFAKLWGLIAFYSVCFWLLSRCALKLSIPFKITGGWFADTYLMLLLIAPVLNIAVREFSRMSAGSVICVWGLFAVGIFLNWVPTHLMSSVAPSGGSDYSLLTFVFIYLTVRIVRTRNLFDHCRLRHIGLGCGIFLVGVLGCSVARVGWACYKGDELSQYLWTEFTSYQSPHVVIMAMTMLCFFVKYVRVPSVLKPILKFCGSCMFGVYLIHTSYTGLGKILYQKPQSLLSANEWGLHPAVQILISAVVCYFACISIEILRKKILYVPIAYLSNQVLAIENWVLRRVPEVRVIL